MMNMKIRPSPCPLPLRWPANAMGGGWILGDVTQGAARRLALPWAIIGRPDGAQARRGARQWSRKVCEKFGFPSPPRDGCPKGVVRWRETWSGCYAKVREVARKSAKVHES